MAFFIQKPTVIQAAGQPPKSVEEFIGRLNSGTSAVSIARMKSPAGWSEPRQTPEFDEYTVVLRGSLHVKQEDAECDVGAGQAIIVQAGEWVQYSSPSPEGAEYIAICIPAFSPETVHREEGQFMTDHEAYDEGYDAYWDGLDRDANPYDEEQEATKRNSWDQGWLEARKHDYDESGG